MKWRRKTQVSICAVESSLMSYLVRVAAMVKGRRKALKSKLCKIPVSISHKTRQQNQTKLQNPNLWMLNGSRIAWSGGAVFRTWPATRKQCCRGSPEEEMDKEKEHK